MKIVIKLGRSDSMNCSISLVISTCFDLLDKNLRNKLLALSSMVSSLSILWMVRIGVLRGKYLIIRKISRRDRMRESNKDRMRDLYSTRLIDSEFDHLKFLIRRNLVDVV
ncbi:hypothetical protein BpHYR1_025116 [Brachionus plicatilis]|uniref:Uncharacterized protein n=1 Tax=Brachionus plicatilis TaxID=10195 RepID=A0A3M7RRR5_BRAPC|nr:hypothetical protein BpHYR1_025116 [Brachionus plicatilis]